MLLNILLAGVLAIGGRALALVGPPKLRGDLYNSSRALVALSALKFLMGDQAPGPAVIGLQHGTNYFYMCEKDPLQWDAHSCSICGGSPPASS